MKPSTILSACLLLAFVTIYSRVAAEATLSLAGEWKFSLEGSDAYSDTIQLPRTMSDAGLGP